jgi:hypothetical protein
MHISTVFVIVGGIAVLALAARGALNVADVTFRWFAERNGY